MKATTTLLKNKLRAAMYEARELFSSQNRTIAMVWSACLLGVLILGYRVQNQANSFIGIADSRESVINFDFPVLVKRINVIAGQAVKKGDLIAELDQPELELKIHEVRSALDKLVAEQNLNREMSHIVSNKGKGKTAAKKKQEVLDASSDPLATEIRNHRKELSVLENRERNLYVFAEISGVIGSVNFKKGETVAPYTPLLTISPVTPTYVLGFLHESLHTQIQVGQKVNVTSLADVTKSVEGRVISVGTRIVELPVRMTRVQSMKTWGREVAIEIPPKAEFLLGEKVEVRPSLRFFNFPMAQAEAEKLVEIKKLVSTPHPIAIPESIKIRTAFEPSGAVYLRDLRKFLVVSDDTDDADTPFLFLLNSDGSLDGSLVRIEGLGPVQDIESISQDENGDLFLLASLSKSGKGKLKHNRNLLAQVKRRGLYFEAVKVIEMRAILLEAVKASKDQEILSLSEEIESKLEVEASFVRNGRLFVALKSPSGELGHSLVLELGSVKTLMAEEKIRPGALKVAQRFDFSQSVQQKATYISDITHADGKLYLTTISTQPGSVGRVWSYDLKSTKLSLLYEFPSALPEGIAFDSEHGTLMVIFDQGNEPALYFKDTDLKK